MFKIDKKQANAILATNKKLNFDTFKSYFDSEKLDDFANVKADVARIMTEEGVFSEIDKINLYDRELLQLFRNVYTCSRDIIHTDYIFNRLHKEFPEFSATKDDFILSIFAINNMRTTEDIFDKLIVGIVEQLRKQFKKKKAKK